MTTFKLTLAYDGTGFAGWQRQLNALGIQQVVEEALAPIAGRRVSVIASGRTDAGVHALGQVASTSFETRLDPETIQRALNADLPESVRVLRVEAAPDSFHARRDAKHKTYCYRLLVGPSYSPFTARYAWPVGRRLDVDAIAVALEAVRGRHDFAAFQSAGSRVRTTVRSVGRAGLARAPLREPCSDDAPAADDETLVTVELTADGFLRHMVRTIVGSLVEVGRGLWTPSDFVAVLESRDRRRAGPTAPARGLFLVRVEY